MRLLTPKEVEEVLKIVDKYTLTFVAQSVGEDILSTDDKALLKRAGIDISSIKPHDSNITQAFKFGILSDAIGHAASKNYTFDQFKESLKTGTFIPLNNQENAMLQSLKYNTYSDIKRLGSNIKGDIAYGILEVDKKGMARPGVVVRDAVAEAIQKRKGVTEVVSIIGHRTEKWNRDLLKVANYNMHEAFNQGRIANMVRSSDGDLRVYFDVYPGACRHCIKLYLTGGIGSEPKRFTIEELQSNGSNIGRKPDEYKPTISPAHVNCRCTANQAPKDYEWDASTMSFTKPKKDIERKVERKSKVRVTVNNKTTEI